MGWRRADLLLRLWLGCAVLGVLGGGNFHAHYYVQLAAPLAALAGIGVERVWRERQALVAGVAAGLAPWGLWATVPLWFDSPAAQAAHVFPDDPHLQHDQAVVDYVRAHSAPGQRILVMWAAANVYYLSNRAPAIPYMWYRNIQAIPGALDDVHAALASAGRPQLVVGEDPAASIDPGGGTARLLHRYYRPAARIGSVIVYRRR